MSHLSKEEADAALGGLTALLKAKAGMVLSECAQTAVLLFGGNGYTRTGKGEIAESEFWTFFLGSFRTVRNFCLGWEEDFLTG